VDLVTGAAGFVGGHLAEELVRRGRALRCVVRRRSRRDRLQRLGVEFVEADLRDGPLAAAAFDGIERVFHVAGVVFGSDAEFFEGNVRATRHLVASLPRGVARLVHVSSLAACGPSPGPEPLTEAAEPRPVSVYGRTKLWGERAARGAGDRAAVTVIRPPVVYGPRDRGLLSFFAAAARGLRPRMGGDRRLSLVHVADLARGIADAAEARTAAGRTYFLCNEASVSFDGVVDLILAAVGRRGGVTVRLGPRLMYEAGALAELAGRLIGRTVPLSRDKARELRRAYWTCDARAAGRDFGWRARIGLEAGLRQTAAWYRTRGWI
jgi:nucleoside-diphosphate-sugar epimerase